MRFNPLHQTPAILAFALLLCLTPARMAYGQAAHEQVTQDKTAQVKTVNAQAAPDKSAPDKPAPDKNVNAQNINAQLAPNDTNSAPSASATDEKDARLAFMEETNKEEAAGAPAPSAFGLLARTLGALLIIVGLILVAGWGVRKFGGARFGTAADAPKLSVVSSVALGDKRSLALIRFGGRTLLVGSTAQSVTLIAEDEEGADETATVATSETMPTPRSVADLLKDNEEAAPFEQQLEASRRRLADAYSEDMREREAAL